MYYVIKELDFWVIMAIVVALTLVCRELIGKAIKDITEIIKKENEKQEKTTRDEVFEEFLKANK